MTTLIKFPVGSNLIRCLNINIAMETGKINLIYFTEACIGPYLFSGKIIRWFKF
jgi:hypothetical protein